MSDQTTMTYSAGLSHETTNRKQSVTRCQRLALLLLIMLITGPVLADNGRNDRDPYKRYLNRVELVLVLRGISTAYDCEVPPTELGTTAATCHDFEVIDVRTNKVIGTAVDSTTDVMEVDGALVATGTTFFTLPHGELVIRGTGTIQPTVAGSPVLNGAPVTHIAGIFPEEGVNSVLSGTGLYSEATGTFSLFGALDLSTVDLGYNTFNCVFFINLNLNKHTFDD